MRLEHVNLTVTDAKAVAAQLCEIFDWHVRWEGPSMDEGYTVHVGDADSYLAIYAPAHELSPAEPRYRREATLNHVGIVVDDLEVLEARVKAAGFTPRSHYDYEPGRRFYFDGPAGVEFEVVCYDD